MAARLFIGNKPTSTYLLRGGTEEMQNHQQCSKPTTSMKDLLLSNSKYCSRMINKLLKKLRISFKSWYHNNIFMQAYRAYICIAFLPTIKNYRPINWHLHQAQPTKLIHLCWYQSFFQEIPFPECYQVWSLWTFGNNLCIILIYCILKLNNLWTWTYWINEANISGF